MTDTDMLYIASLEKRNEELEAKVAELEGKHWNECTIISQYDDELKEAKRLLKVAVEDMTKEADCGICLHDNDSECPIEVTACKFKWRHTDEALALIGEDTNVPASADDTNVGGKIDSWISCKDNMPDTLERGLSTMYSDCCLVCDAFGWVGMAYYVTDGQKSWWEFADAQNQNKIDWTEVTHWMPLPEPPKDGDTNG